MHTICKSVHHIRKFKFVYLILNPMNKVGRAYGADLLYVFFIQLIQIYATS